MLLKDALSLCFHLRRGYILIRDFDNARILSATDVKKDGNYLVVEETTIPLHRIIAVFIDDEIKYLKSGYKEEEIIKIIYKNMYKEKEK